MTWIDEPRYKLVSHGSMGQCSRLTVMQLGLFSPAAGWMQAEVYLRFLGILFSMHPENFKKCTKGADRIFDSSKQNLGRAESCREPVAFTSLMVFSVHRITGSVLRRIQSILPQRPLLTCHVRLVSWYGTLNVQMMRTKCAHVMQYN